MSTDRQLCHIQAHDISSCKYDDISSLCLLWPCASGSAPVYAGSMCGGWVWGGGGGGGWGPPRQCVQAHLSVSMHVAVVLQYACCLSASSNLSFSRIILVCLASSAQKRLCFTCHVHCRSSFCSGSHVVLLAGIQYVQCKVTIYMVLQAADNAAEAMFAFYS